MYWKQSREFCSWLIPRGNSARSPLKTRSLSENQDWKYAPWSNINHSLSNVSRVIMSKSRTPFVPPESKGIRLISRLVEARYLTRRWRGDFFELGSVSSSGLSGWRLKIKGVQLDFSLSARWELPPRTLNPTFVHEFSRKLFSPTTRAMCVTTRIELSRELWFR